MLAISQTSTNSTNVTLDLPDCLSSKVLNALKADARTVELRAQAPYFYALGTRILELFEDEELSDVLSEVSRSLLSFEVESDQEQSFKKRSKEIADQAHNSHGSLGDGADFLHGLDDEERQCRHIFSIFHPFSYVCLVFRKAHDSARAVRTWMADLHKA
jgi:GINS complex subunit 3